ncbi:MAG: hypothetical protein ACKV22_31750 [Bryobacteraceae bacterium]
MIPIFTPLSVAAFVPMIVTQAGKEKANLDVKSFERPADDMVM